MREIIRNYINNNYLINDFHLSYCYYPFEKCTCKKNNIDDILLIQSGYVDSISMMDIIVFIEEEFEISIGFGDATIDNFESIDSIILLIKKIKEV